MKDFIIASLIFMFSVISVSVAAEERRESAQQQEVANLVIYRAADRSAMNYRLLVDGKHVGKLDRGRVIRLQLPAGEHIISANDKQRSNISVTVGTDTVIYVRGDVDKRQQLSLQVLEPSQGLLARVAATGTIARVN